MKVVVAGGSGFVGRSLCLALEKNDHRVTVLTRGPKQTAAMFGSSVEVVQWDGQHAGPWDSSIDGADAIINLAGEPIAAGRWTSKRKHVIRESRLSATRALVQAIAHAKHKPRTLINASGIGFYGPRDAMHVSEKAQAGEGFLAELCVSWEREAVEAERYGLRVVLLRSGMVLGKGGGALSQMLAPFRMFLGGPISPGYQWVSWIHLEDLIGLIGWALANDSVSGPLNAVAPEAVTMREFCRTLGRVLHRPSWLPVPAFALRLGLGELSTMLTTGQRVEPAVALRGGYVFKHPSLAFALHDILDRPMSPPRGERTAA